MTERQKKTRPTYLYAEPEAWARLAEAVVKRRVEMGLNQREAAAAAQIGYVTWNQLENSKQATYRAASLRQVEELLGWEPSAIRRYLEDEKAEPKLAPQAPVEEPKEPATDDALKEELLKERKANRELRQQITAMEDWICETQDTWDKIEDLIRRLPRYRRP